MCAENRDPSTVELLINSTLLLMSVTVGYWAMLLTMIYNVQLFFCVIFGLALGHFISNVIFVHINKRSKRNKGNSSSNSNMISIDDSDGNEDSGSSSCCASKKNVHSDVVNIPSNSSSCKNSNASNNNNNNTNAVNTKLPDTPCCPY